MEKKMFGMLDYRAHKLYLITIAPIKWILFTGFYFLCPIISVLAAKATTDIEWGIITLIIIYYLFASAIGGLLVSVPLFLLEKIFFFFIDVIPTGDHNEEEALEVVKNGKKAIIMIKIAKRSPRDWKEEDIIKCSNFIFLSKYLSERVYNRMNFIKNYYIQNEITEIYNENLMQQILKDNKLDKTFLEKLLHPYFISLILQLLIIMVTYKILIQ